MEPSQLSRLQQCVPGAGEQCVPGAGELLRILNDPQQFHCKQTLSSQP